MLEKGALNIFVEYSVRLFLCGVLLFSCFGWYAFGLDFMVK